MEQNPETELKLDKVIESILDGLPLADLISLREQLKSGQKSKNIHVGPQANSFQMAEPRNICTGCLRPWCTTCNQIDTTRLNESEVTASAIPICDPSFDGLCQSVVDGIQKVEPVFNMSGRRIKPLDKKLKLTFSFRPDFPTYEELTNPQHSFPKCINWEYPKTAKKSTIPWHASYLAGLGKLKITPKWLIGTEIHSGKPPEWFQQQTRAILEWEQFFRTSNDYGDNDDSGRDVPDPRVPWGKLLESEPEFSKRLWEQGFHRLLQCDCLRCLIKAALMATKSGLGLKALVTARGNDFEYIQQEYTLHTLDLRKRQKESLRKLLLETPVEEFVLYLTTTPLRPSTYAILVAQFSYIENREADKIYLRWKKDPDLPRPKSQEKIGEIEFCFIKIFIAVCTHPSFSIVHTTFHFSLPSSHGAKLLSDSIS